MALANSVYIWNYFSNKVEKLTNFDDFDIAAGISYDLKSENLVIGTLNGNVEIWDPNKWKLFKKIKDH